MKHLTEFVEQIDALAFVPTMGALHDGHLALIKQARESCESSKRVLVSIYVNPTQFESVDDLARYPKTLSRDLELAQDAGADYLWTPSVHEIYPEGLANVSLISAGPLGDLYEGASRPQHFSGVLTVINRLFTITKPECAIFGEKDFQQLFLIQKFAQEKFPNIEIVAGQTVRDENGIALSSRNLRLSPEEMQIARVLPRTRELALGAETIGKLRELLRGELSREPGFTLDYVEVVNPSTLLPVSNDFQGAVQVLIAGWIGSVRLIDNFAFTVKEQR